MATMSIKTICLSFPMDFLVNLSQGLNESKIRNFTASGPSEGGIISSVCDETQYQISFKCENKRACLSVSGDFFQLDNNLLRCKFDKWSELNLNGGAKTDKSKSSRKRKTLHKKGIDGDVKTAKVQKIDPGELKGLTHKARQYAVSTRSRSKKDIHAVSTDKTKLMSNQKGNPAAKVPPKQEKFVEGLNLRPRVSRVNWSALGDDSDDESDEDSDEDSENHQGKGPHDVTSTTKKETSSVESNTVVSNSDLSTQSKDSQVKYGPLMVASEPLSGTRDYTVQNEQGLKIILPKPGVVKPVVVPTLPPKPPPVYKTKKKKTVAKFGFTPQGYKPMNRIVTKIAQFGKGIHPQLVGSVVNIPASFPLLDSTGTFKVTENLSDGTVSRYCLVPDSEETSADETSVSVSFYNNISKGVEVYPSNPPMKFERIPVKENAELPIIINLRKLDSNRKNSGLTLKKKLAAIQEVTGPLPPAHQDQDSEENENIQSKVDPLRLKLKELQEKIDKDGQDSASTTFNFKKSLREKLTDIQRKTGPLVEEYKPPGRNVKKRRRKRKRNEQFIGTKLLALKEKMGAEETASSSSSSDSEMEYEDEVDLIKIPELSVIRTTSFDPKKSYVTLRPGNKIPLLQFEISSTDLLKASDNRFYIQGTKEGVEGLVLLGPFVMEYNPRAYLNFLPPPQSLRRIPKCIYNRRRERWLRKQGSKQYAKPTVGEVGDQEIAFIDHNYLAVHQENMLQSVIKESSNDQREITQNTPFHSEDVYIVSTWGVPDQVDVADIGPYSDTEESRIPLIGCLEEAMTFKHSNTLASDSAPLLETASGQTGSVDKFVSFDDLPPVTVEATLNSLGIQLGWRVLRRHRQESDQGEQIPALPVENDDTLYIPYRYTCKYCLKVMTTNFKLYDHIRSTHQSQPGFMDYAREVQRKEGVRCEYCVKEVIFYSQDGLRTHTNTHHPEKVTGRSSRVEKRTCATCKKVFAQLSVLRKHIERVHECRQFLCDKCPGIFKSEEALSNHIKGKHDNIRNFTCHICGASYVTPAYLKKHVKHVHKDKDSTKESSQSDLPVKRPGRGAPGVSRSGQVKKCILCGHAFDPANLKKHMRQIHGVDFTKMKRCGECSLTFNTRSELEYHRHSSHGMEYHMNCPYCGAAYIIKNNLHEHILTFHYSLHLHQCYICSKVYTKALKLTEHMLQDHPGVEPLTEDRNLPCSHCPDKFKTHKSLVEHVLSSAHNDVFQHACLACPQRFMHQHDLEHHIKVVHGINEDMDFEIRCNSTEDRIVQMVVNREVHGVSDLPVKAQLALKRLHSQGKHIMIVSKEEGKDKKGAKLKPESDRDITESSDAVEVNASGQLNKSESSKGSKMSLVTDTSAKKEVVSSSMLAPKITATVSSRPTEPRNEVLKVYRMAVQSEEVARASRQDPLMDRRQDRQMDRQQEVVEEQVLSVDEEFVVAEQIGRLDDRGNIIEDRVVYLDYEPVPQEMLLDL